MDHIDISDGFTAAAGAAASTASGNSPTNGGPASNANICPGCGARDAFESDEAQGSLVCTSCGEIIEENAIVSAIEFVEGQGGASAMVGQFVSATSTKAFTARGAAGGYGFSRDSRETTLLNGKKRITDVAARLRIRPDFVDIAHRFFTMAVERNFVQGRRTINVVAACLYIACRQEKSKHMLIDFSDTLQVNVYTLGACFLKFRRMLGLDLPVLDPALYIYRFTPHLSLGDKKRQVETTALRLVGRMKRDWIVTGRRPAGICAAALLIAARAHGFHRQPQDVTRILRVCGLTVTQRIKEFENTPSSKLTLEQFNRVEFQTEADPPVFTKNRIREARARAIDEKNYDLLNSGSLDDPMSGKRNKTKWRDGRASKKAVAFEQLYESLAVEAEQVGAVIAGSTSGEADPVDAEEEKTEEENQMQEEHGMQSQEGHNTDEIENGPEQEANGSNPPESEQQLTVRDKVAVRDNIESVDGKDVKWTRAYPKDHFGGPIVLPDHITDEQRQPPTQPVEGRLDTKSWQKDMPKEMIDDIDLIFLSPEEAAQKEALFVKDNKAYLEKEALKEKQRASEEQAKSNEDEEMAQQAKGMERLNRKRNKARDKNTPVSAQEAMIQSLENRKISRKLNYNALEAVFEAPGEISTSGMTFSTFEQPEYEDL